MKAFFKQLVASFFGSCLSLAAVVIVVVFGGIALLGLLSTAVSRAVNAETETQRAALPQNAMLVIDLSRGFSDASTFGPSNVSGIFSDEKGRYGLLDTLRALTFAQADERIAGVILVGGNAAGDGSFASREELYRALLEFRAVSGKPVYAYLPSPSYRDYYLASAADKIWIHPLSELPVNGLSSTTLYFKNALEKAGIGVQIARVGTHKSAVEPLISDKMSPEDFAQRKRVLDTVWRQSLMEIALVRGNSGNESNFSAEAAASSPFTANLLEKITFSGLVPAEEAAQSRLVDAVLYEDEVIERLKAVAGADTATNSFRQVSLENYLRDCAIAVEPPISFGNIPAAATATGVVPAANTVPAEADDSDAPAIAVIFAEGEIVDGYGSAQEVGGAGFSRALRDLRNDDSVKAVVMRVNSPGGSVFASEQIRREAALLAQKKPFVVSMGDVAASGGYWISTPAKKIFADPLTITGSIGVFGVMFNFEALGKKIGVNSEGVLSAPLAELGTMRRPKTDKELAIFQKLTEQIYAKFLALVSDSRKLPIARVNEIAQGQVWIGTDALHLGLVDEIGGLVEAVDFARNEAGLGDNYEILSVPGPVNRYQELFDKFSNSNSSDPVALAGTASGTTAGTSMTDAAAQAALRNAAANPALKAVLKNIERVSARLRAFNDPNGIYARLPFDIETQD